MWETWVRSLGWEDPLEEGMAAHSSILAWRIPSDRGVGWGLWGPKQSDLAEWLSTDSNKQQRLPTHRLLCNESISRCQVGTRSGCYTGREEPHFCWVSRQHACRCTHTADSSQSCCSSMTCVCTQADTVQINRGSTTCILKWVAASCSWRGSQQSPPSHIFHSL